MKIVQTSNLTKRFGKFTALDGIDLVVNAGLILKATAKKLP